MLVILSESHEHFFYNSKNISYIFQQKDRSVISYLFEYWGVHEIKLDLAANDHEFNLSTLSMTEWDS